LQQLLIPRGMLGGYPHGHLRGAEENVQVTIAVGVTYGDSHPSAPVLIFNAGPHNGAIGLLHEQQKSLWKGKSPVRIEGDNGEVQAAIAIVVEPRGAHAHGLGQELLNAVRARTTGRVEWAVLNWNELAQNFYRTAGAAPLDDWTVWRV
jgi:hypothetical protein